MRQYQESPLQQAIQSQRAVTPEGVRPACVVFENGLIVAVRGHTAPSDALVVDVGELYLLPGLVDSHVHINEPGRTEWEGFRTATRAAAAGGYTCLVDMPLNSIPATINVAALEQKRASARGQCMVDYAFWGGTVHDNSDALGGLAEAGVRGFKCFMVPSGVDEFEMVNEADLRLALPVIAATGLPLLVHAEFPSLIADAKGKTWTRYADYLASRPDASEVRAIELLIRLCREFHCPIHIVHLASADPLAILAAARAEGLPISVETCPHYLTISAEEIPDGATQNKCAPPIRDLKTQALLWDALRDGIIDLIATDHSPCPPALKRSDTGDFARAWGGIASLSLALSAIHTAAMPRGFGMERIVQWMSERPAKLAGLDSHKGRLASGFDADFVVFNPDAEFTVDESHLHFRHAVTPYLGRALRGRVAQTFVRGECVYRHGEFTAAAPGRECTV
jgi:allantoinase